MKLSPMTKALFFGLAGLILGCLLTAILAQRASYFWAMEQLARISFTFEESAKNSAAAGRTDDAQQSLSAALRLRKAAGEIDEDRLIWPLGTPGAVVLDVVQNVSGPAMGLGSGFSDPSVAYLYECALFELSFSTAEDGVRMKELNRIGAKYPKSKPDHCAAVGRAYWAK